jgi:plastocyanin
VSGRLALALLLLPAGASAGELRGRIELRENGAPAADLAQAVVWFEPAGGARPAPRAVDVVTENKRFLPRVTAVPVGSTVRFPNRDPLRHNVFSVSPSNRFDLGLYGQGEGRDQRFDKKGLVRVYCNVHHAMVAYVLVLDTPHVASPDAAGGFALEGVPEGAGRLNVWHERAGTWTLDLESIPPEPVVARMTITQARLPAHLDKHGRPYDDDERSEAYR